MMWIGHLAFFGLSALLYIMTSFGFNVIDYLFVTSVNLTNHVTFVMYIIVAFLLFLGAAIVNKGSYISEKEVWSVAATYTVCAAITGFVQIWYSSDLNAWYYDRMEFE